MDLAAQTSWLNNGENHPNSPSSGTPQHAWPCRPSTPACLLDSTSGFPGHCPQDATTFHFFLLLFCGTMTTLHMHVFHLFIYSINPLCVCHCHGIRGTERKKRNKNACPCSVPALVWTDRRHTESTAGCQTVASAIRRNTAGNRGRSGRVEARLSKSKPHPKVPVRIITTQLYADGRDPSGESHLWKEDTVVESLDRTLESLRRDRTQGPGGGLTWARSTDNPGTALGEEAACGGGCPSIVKEKAWEHFLTIASVLSSKVIS